MPEMIARRFAAVALLAITGCVSTTALDQPWIEVSSANFSIYTSLDDAPARGLMEDLELFRAALLSVTRLRDTKPRIPTEIYAFAATSDYAPFRPHRSVPGYFVPGLRGNFVAMDMGDSPSLARTVLYHEYTHFLVRNEGRAAVPKWFDEGFAEVLGSVDVLGAMVRIGAVPPHRVQWLVHGPKIPYDQIIRARSFNGWPLREVAAFYAQSWLLAHHLTLGQGGKFTSRLDRYLDEVDRGVDPVEAFENAFDIDVDDLDERMAKYAKEIPAFGLPRRDLAQGLQIRVRPVPLDEIGARLGWLAMSIGKRPLAEGLFERAAAQNPANARAVAGLGDIDKLKGNWDEAETAYRRSLELAPDDWQNHLEFAEYYTHRAEQEEEGRDERLARAREHFARAIELEPANPEAHAMLGFTYTIGNQPGKPGIASLEHAAKLLPSHSGIEFPLAKLHHRAGHRERAIELLRRVVNRPHGDINEEATELLEELEERGNGG
jgi:tetratricopeptide (TPR) repeat protein